MLALAWGTSKGKTEDCSGYMYVVFKLIKFCNEDQRKDTAPWAHFFPSVPKKQWTYTAAREISGRDWA